MHELSLSRAILSTALRHAEGRPVREVRLRVGALRQVVPESLDFYFGITAEGTLCEGARLDQERVPATLRCEGCGQRWRPSEPLFRCGRCGSGPVEVLSGEEFEIASIEVEEEEEQECIAPG